MNSPSVVNSKQDTPSGDSPRILILGAHPDDADIKAGGTAAKWAKAGFVVKLVSLCDGGAGHQEMHGPALVARRRQEAAAAGAILGATYEVLDQPDGRLQPTLAVREALIRFIRRFQPDLIITHRTTDYHPDHCYTGLLVQEAAYLLTVPAICPDVPHLTRSPVILYFSDAFKHPSPFHAEVVIDIGDEFETLVAMLDCHASQFYEWLPYNSGKLAEVPQGPEARRRWLADRMASRLRPLADRYRQQVINTYGPAAAQRVELIEAFQVSEFGAPLDEDTRLRLFPFLPAGIRNVSSCSRKEWVDVPEADSGA